MIKLNLQLNYNQLIISEAVNLHGLVVIQHRCNLSDLGIVQKCANRNIQREWNVFTFLQGKSSSGTALFRLAGTEFCEVALKTEHR